MAMIETQRQDRSSILDRYLANLSVEVEPFALCLLETGWRLTLPGASTTRFSCRR